MASKPKQGKQFLGFPLQGNKMPFKIKKNTENRLFGSSKDFPPAIC